MIMWPVHDDQVVVVMVIILQGNLLCFPSSSTSMLQEGGKDRVPSHHIYTLQ